MMDKKIDRRNFIKKATIGLVGLEVGYLVFDAIQNKENISNKSLFSLGQASAFEKNTMYPFTSGKFYLSVMEDGGMLALSIKCTHLGCMVRKSNNGFECPCHASAFDKYGEVLSPPANRALDLFPIHIENDELFVDTNNPIRRQKFDASQLTYV